MPLQRYEIEQCSGLFHFRLGISLVMLTDRNLDERNEAIPYKMQTGSKPRRRSRRELFTLKLCYRYNVLLFFSCYGLFNLFYLSSSAVQLFCSKSRHTQIESVHHGIFGIAIKIGFEKLCISIAGSSAHPIGDRVAKGNIDKLPGICMD